ncbi:hypothetical protein SI62_17660 [Salmonella enterica]|nr:hypothetical protein [Salmonella enterica]
MVTKPIHLMELIKLFLLLVKEDDKKYEPEVYLHALPKSGLGGIKIHGRGGLEVSSSEIKNSPEFIAMEIYAKERIRSDGYAFNLIEEYHNHRNGKGGAEQK